LQLCSQLQVTIAYKLLCKLCPLVFALSHIKTVITLEAVVVNDGCTFHRIYYVVLLVIEGASPGELHKLLQERLKAMTTVDTEVRLNNAMDYAEQSRAKVALQSLQLG
jgi:hypothetical protein